MVSRVSQGSFRKMSRVFQVRLKGASSTFMGGFKGIKKVCQGNFNVVSRVFEGSLKNVSSKF